MNWHHISHLSREERAAVQNAKLRHFFRHALPYSPYYRELFKKYDLSLADVRTTDDLVKLPFTTKEDLAPREDDRARPKQFILQPDEHLIKKFAPKSHLLKLLWKKITKQDVTRRLEWEYKPIHLHFTTGRTALPTPFAYTACDLETLKETGKRLLDVSGISHKEVGINAFPYSPHLAFWLTYYAMATIGMTSLATGGGKIMGTQKIIDAIERMKAGVVAFIPGYCYHLLREAVKQKRDFSNLKHVLFGGERVSDGLRQKVKEMCAALGAPRLTILATYAMTESKTAWIQCHEASGYHLYPDMEFIELVDEEGRRVREGGGEIVYTALNWRGSVVVRYKTGDLAKGIEEGACPHCGKTVPRIVADIQRSSDVKEFHLTKVKGELVNLNNFYPLLSGMKELEEWQVVIRKKHNDPFEVDEIILLVALVSGTPPSFLPVLAKTVQSEIGVAVNVVEAPMADLLAKLGMETELKEKRIIDERPKA
jgi:phenylacetate-coenzyme A ligase PaaK-like adenylate-forming protein